MNLCIFGSRSLSGVAVIDLLNEIRSEVETAARVTCIVTAGEPAGVCAEARAVARSWGLPLKLYFLNKPRIAGGAWEWRSKPILNDCDHCALIHDGFSRGR
jgi:hypothetical protein